MGKIRVYEVCPEEGCELCQPLSAADFENINVLINGKVRAQEWKPIPVRIIRESANKKRFESDSPWLGSHALIFRSNTLKVLEPMLRKYGEVLPLECRDADLSIYNVTCVIDALDEGTSTVSRFDDGRIMVIRRYGFRPDALQAIEIFKIPNLRVSPTFVSQHFVDHWNRCELRGLSFKEVWQSV